MADDTDVLMKLCEHEWAQMKQSEDQRSIITNVVIVLTSAIIGYTVQKGFSQEVIPLTILLIVLGVFGAITTAKLYERHQLHYERARVFRNQALILHPASSVSEERAKSFADHKKKFPILSKLHVHQMWLILHFGVSFIGMGLTLLILVR